MAYFVSVKTQAQDTLREPAIEQSITYFQVLTETVRTTHNR